MGPLMYKHHPSYPALLGAACVIVLGACSACRLENRIKAGEDDRSTLLLVICLSVAISGVLLIIAFARYRFTHLKTDRAFFRKEKKHRTH